jgi:hypothetical protein
MSLTNWGKRVLGSQPNRRRAFPPRVADCVAARAHDQKPSAGIASALPAQRGFARHGRACEKGRSKPQFIQGSNHSFSIFLSLLIDPPCPIRVALRHPLGVKKAISSGVLESSNHSFSIFLRLFIHPPCPIRAVFRHPPGVKKAISCQYEQERGGQDEQDEQDKLPEPDSILLILSQPQVNPAALVHRRCTGPCRTR